MKPMTITGKIAHIIYTNPDNHYTILKLDPYNEYEAQAPDGTLTIVGNMSQTPQVGDIVAFEGGWVENPRYGTQFQALDLKIQQAQLNLQTTSEVLPQGDQLVGRVERITFYNEENGWGVIKIDPAKEANYPDDALAYDGTIAVVGVMPNLIEGESAQFTGKWVVNHQYGRQFKAETAVAIAPKDESGIIRYIADTVFGVGERTAKRIYDHFGEDTLNILDASPERVRDVPGLKPKLADNLIQEWTTSERTSRQLMIHLQSMGLSSLLAQRVIKYYKENDPSLNLIVGIETNPYLLTAVDQIGFKKADDIARHLGIAPDDPQRLRAGLVYALAQMTRDGHTFAPREVLTEMTTELLKVTGYDIDLDQEIREQILAGNLKADILPVGDDPQVGVIYLPRFYNSEVGAAKRIKKMLDTPSRIYFKMKPTNWDDYLGDLAEENQVKLSDEQQGAVKAAMLSKISVLTGGPGTGKTTTLRMVIDALDQEEFSYLLASPTGRAAKRLQEATGREAKTIHRLLGWNPMGGGFDHDDENPLDTDFIIIDEASMIDLMLFNSLLKAIRSSSHLMLVGDIDQLPSVGAGNVLNDVINSEIGHVTRLSQIFRQEESSHIVTNAHRINKGVMPYTDNESTDFFFFNMESPEDAAEIVVDLVAGRLERKVGKYDPFNDVQVIAPMYRGPIGVNALNQALQERLNSGYHLEEKRLGGKVFRKNDKVMQTKNNYEKDIFNGDIGTVYAIDHDENVIVVQIDGVKHNFTFEDADDELIHAYCISTHRSQGSEYPIVVMPVMTQHYMMLQRNLLYTAITRAKKMVVLVGTRKALQIAVNNNKVAERYSGLIERLK